MDRLRELLEKYRESLYKSGNSPYTDTWENYAVFMRNLPWADQGAQTWAEICDFMASEMFRWQAEQELKKSGLDKPKPRRPQPHFRIVLTPRFAKLFQKYIGSKAKPWRGDIRIYYKPRTRTLYPEGVWTRAGRD